MNAFTTNAEKNQFGNRHVSATEKTALVHTVFDNVAFRYDVMNDAMSGGLHRLWKNHFIHQIRPRSSQTCLDLAGGTGDIAFRLHDATQGRAQITLCDLTYAMLDVGRSRALDTGRYKNLHFVTGNAESMPFPDHNFDVVTIAFGLRNVTHIDTALAEIYRVLKPGGRFFCMEFSHVDEPIVRRLYDLYSFQVIPRLGKILTKDRDSYQYLVESIRLFPKREALKQRMEQAGFARTHVHPMTFGVVAIHSGMRL